MVYDKTHKPTVNFRLFVPIKSRNHIVPCEIKVLLFLE